MFKPKDVEQTVAEITSGMVSDDEQLRAFHARLWPSVGRQGHPDIMRFRVHNGDLRWPDLRLWHVLVSCKGYDSLGCSWLGAC